MIVKDEAEVIERCLAAARPFIDAWVICDTGSSDDTVQRVRSALEGIPGEVHQRPWVGFAHNRSEALELARGKADYTLVIDADHVLEGDPGLLDDLTQGGYHLQIRRAATGHEWTTLGLLRSDRNWRYEGVVHEYPVAEHEVVTERLPGVTIVDQADGGTGGRNRWESDAKLLEEELARNPADPRTVFYLAQTYRDLGRTVAAAEMFDRRAALEGWAEEKYYALYQAGVMRARLGDWPRAAEAFQRAIELRPSRAEALYDYLGGLRDRNRHQIAHALAAAALDKPVPDDLLFVQPWVYEWGIRFEYSIAAYWVGEYESALASCDELLARTDLPGNFRAAVQRNRTFCVQKLA